MSVTYLGQAGLLFEFDGVKIMVDPYLSDSVRKVNPANYRRQPIDETWFRVRPDILILTHDHLDHTDPETLKILLHHHSSICVLASHNAWSRVRQYGGDHNYVSFNAGTSWTEKGITFEAVHAEHSDSYAIGVVIHHKRQTWYVTGDTLYHKKVLASAPIGVDAVFLPINGVGNNMNVVDAVHFAAQIKAQKAVPIHWGMFDELDPHSFSYEHAVIPTIYEEIEL